AISFGVDQVKDEDAKTIMVFDFGGGTFDLSVFTISGGQFIEQGKGGNMWLGGEDIDRKIEDFVLGETEREYGIEDIGQLIDHQETGKKIRFLGELKAAVEQAKINLSDQEATYVEILGLLKDNDGDLLDIDITLTRKQLETIIQPVVETAMELSRKLLDDIYFTPDLIDNVLLVGGSSKIPCIIKAVEAMFGPDKVLVHERPMLAIAEGAAILSHRLSDTYECAGCGKTVSQSDIVCSSCGFDLEKHTIDQGVLDIVHATAHDYYVALENGDRYLFVEKNTPLPCEQTEVFKLVHSDQNLVHMKFSNMVNDKEESIGDFWLGFDHKTIDKYRTNHSDETRELPFSIEVTLKIDENNLVEVAASLKELPEVELSKTLSRGQADEKLFKILEKIINEANEKGYETYTINDITTRTVSILKEIHRVIDQKTGEVIEPVYNLAEMNLDKTKRLAEEGVDCYAFIYYAENLLETFLAAFSSKDKSLMKKKIEHLKTMNLNGTYEENLDAYNDLDRLIDKFPLPNILMRITKAADLCEENDPPRAPKFYGAISSILAAVEKENSERIDATLDKILPEVDEVIQQYDSKTGTIKKGITR
ncbi:MAG: hypothetical protein DRH26_06230, partial [Deltaproteobacteria bacterium]